MGTLPIASNTTLHLPDLHQATQTASTTNQNTAHPTNDLLTIVSPRPPPGYNSGDHFQSSYGPLQNPNPHSRPSINGPPLSYPGGSSSPYPPESQNRHQLSAEDAKSKDDIHYSVKMRSTGKSVFRKGKFKDGGAEMGVAKDRSLMSSKSIALELTYNFFFKLTSGGAEAEFGSDSAFGDKRWLLDMTINGRKEVWVWEANKQSLSQKLSGQNKGVSLRRAGSNGPPAAIFTHEDDSMGSTRSTIGCFELQGPALTGELGDDFQDFALLAWCRMTQEYLRRRSR
ncbi:hypothetical protein DL768_006231 [Monosporascus sp. mg162]|nr:hypothetical protein DL768_006231 [Monosporascus sp. mg162]